MRVFAVVLCVGCFVGLVGVGVQFGLGHPVALVTLSEERRWASFLPLAAKLTFLPPALVCMRLVVLAANYCTFLLLRAMRG